MWAAKAGVDKSSHLSSKATLVPSVSNFASPTPSVTTGVGLSAAPERSASNFSSWADAAPAMANAPASEKTMIVRFMILLLAPHGADYGSPRGFSYQSPRHVKSARRRASRPTASRNGRGASPVPPVLVHAAGNVAGEL